MANQNNILTEEEIKEAVSKMCSKCENPAEECIRAVEDYFWLRPNELKYLTDKEFRGSFIRHIYMHQHALDSYIKADKKVKGLQSLIISLEKERMNRLK